ncbi:MAG: hypothetical protein RI885_2542 [Actinomycetota bacterium]|jgi:elongation factor Ts
MAHVSLADVKTLRDRLGTGMVDTKNALVEADGDLDKATELLRLKGAKGNAKRADRSTSEGLVAAKQVGRDTTLIELVCETDFVAKGERFGTLGQTVLDAVTAAGAKTVDEALAASVDPAAGSGTVGELIGNEAAVLGEKVELRRLTVITADEAEIYLHRTSKDLPPQVGVVVGYTGSDSETARGVAQHIAFADPQVLGRDDVPADEVERERAIVTEIAKGEGKPDAALPKIIEGRITGFFKQVALLEQDYAKDNKQSVAKVLDAADVTVTGFARFKVGA